MKRNESIWNWLYFFICAIIPSRFPVMKGAPSLCTVPKLTKISPASRHWSWKLLKISIPRVLSVRVPKASNSSKQRKSSDMAQIKYKTCTKSVVSVDSSKAIDNIYFPFGVLRGSCSVSLRANSCCQSVMVLLERVSSLYFETLLGSKHPATSAMHSFTISTSLNGFPFSLSV